jgi:hypothetical protein
VANGYFSDRSVSCSKGQTGVLGRWPDREDESLRNLCSSAQETVDDSPGNARLYVVSVAGGRPRQGTGMKPPVRGRVMDFAEAVIGSEAPARPFSVLWRQPAGDGTGRDRMDPTIPI